ncbi:MAG: alpha/beta fold hydrolase [Desulfosalsimonas sp.]|uniref:alpha/beta hydrolase n=1 Tax=Desulfosalsimonas sp. TaxID=3073848 RepID=UPI003970A866
MPASTSQSTETIIAKDGTPLFTRHFPAGSDPRACMVIVHGLCEHSGRYEQMAEFLNKRGIRVTAYDQRGHGQSGGPRGHVQDFDHLTDDLMQVIQKCRQQMDENLPLLSVPLLLQAAGDDHLVDAGASRKFFEQIKSSDKTLHIYPGLSHEIYNEEPSRRQQVLTDLEIWLENHVR